MQDHADLKLKLEREYDEQAESKRSFQQDIEMLMTLSRRIKEYVDLPFLVANIGVSVFLID